MYEIFFTLTESYFSINIIILFHTRIVMALHKVRVIQNQQRFSAVFTSKAPFTRYNLLLNRFDNRLYRVNGV